MDFKLKEFDIALKVTRLANIHYFEFPNEYRTKTDSHPFRELVYVDSGELYVESESYVGVLHKNQCIIHKEGESHSLRCTAESAPSVIIIGFECNSLELDRFCTIPVSLPPTLQKYLTEIIREGRSVFLPPYDMPDIKDMKKRADYPYGADQMIKLKLESFLISLIRSDTAETVFDSDTSEGVGEIMVYINENFSQNIKLDELCFLFGTNKTTLCKRFRDAYGCTVINYINDCRIKKAKELMRQGKYTMSEIALKVGFSSVHYFTRTFKARTRTTPTEYIKTIKSKLGI